MQIGGADVVAVVVDVDVGGLGDRVVDQAPLHRCLTVYWEGGASVRHMILGQDTGLRVSKYALDTELFGTHWGTCATPETAA